MKNVKTLLIFITISTFIYASGARVAVLGGAGFWADDYANISAFPASVNNHNVAWTNGSDFTTVANVDGTTWGFSGGSGDDVANIMWGNGTMGVTLGLGMTPEKTVADHGVAADAETALSVGFGMPLSGMDFGVTYGMGCSDCGGGNVGLNLRRAQDIWLFENILVDFDMLMEEKTAGAITTPSNMGLGAHLYRNTAYDNGITSLFGLGFTYGDAGKGSVAADPTKDPDAAIGIEWNFGVESDMTDWATLRLGYSHAYDFADGGADGTDPQLVAGVGFDYGSFNLDIVLMALESMMHDPVKYMTGRNTNALGKGFTVSYTW